MAPSSALPQPGANRILELLPPDDPDRGPHEVIVQVADSGMRMSAECFATLLPHCEDYRQTLHEYASVFGNNA